MNRTSGVEYLFTAEGYRVVTGLETGLETGADDYVRKPFNNRELVLRVGR